VRSLIPFAISAACVILPIQLLTAQQVLPLWPAGSLPNTSSDKHERDTTTDKDHLVGGKRVIRLTDVTNPTMAVYPAPATDNTRVGVVVFPGGGYTHLAYDLEGSEVCEWLNSIGVGCAAVKYRVPGAGHYPEHTEDLADAQRAVRMMRQHATEWKIDPARVGVLGFSAGGHLVAVISNHASESTYKDLDAADQLSARPAFAIMIYPGGLVKAPDLMKLPPALTPGNTAPPTFLVQAEDDPVHVENTIAYYLALKNANVPAEMHVFAKGGHGYGLRPTELPVTHWPQLAAEWLRMQGFIAPDAK